jgi:hypothetical protein
MSALLALALASAVSARLPGTTQTVEGVRLVPGAALVSEDHGIARTVREDVVLNDTWMQLEARYVLRVPAGAAVSRVALDVDGALVEGEVVTRARAAAIYRGIVDVPPVPRDPALVERLPDGAVSVKIFPVPAHGSRRILIAYDTPAAAPSQGHAEVSLGRAGFVLRVPAPRGTTSSLGPVARAIVLDASRGQQASLPRARALAHELVAALAPGEPFAVLVCDSACAAFPPEGLAKKGATSAEELGAWLPTVPGGGARDVAGAIAQGASRARAGSGSRGDVVWLGAGRATSGHLDAADLAMSARASLDSDVDLRAVGLGDSGELAALANAVGGTFDDGDPASPPADALHALAVRLLAPQLHAPSLELPTGLALAGPPPGPLVVGDALVALGTFVGEPRGDVTIRATVRGQPFVWTTPLVVVARGAGQADVLLAQARVDALEARGDVKSLAAATELARAHKVLAKGASWLVLEDDEMFEENGIVRHARARTKGTGARAVAPGDVRTAPVLHMSSFSVSARLPPERIRHFVHLNHARVRFCYEQGLRANTALEGRVAIKFVIASSGAVVRAEDGGSDLPDREVVACVARVMGEMVFPAGAFGNVTVTYPFVFSPAPGTTAGAMILPLRVPPSTTPDPHELWRLRTRVEEAPEDAAAHDAYVHALMAVGQRDLALAAAEQFVRAFPAAARAYEVLLELAPPARTATALDALADLRPLDARVHERAAAAFARMGDGARAASHLLAARSPALR